jgi:hypothetical protein
MLEGVTERAVDAEVEKEDEAEVVETSEARVSARGAPISTGDDAR